MKRELKEFTYALALIYTLVESPFPMKRELKEGAVMTSSSFIAPVESPFPMKRELKVVNQVAHEDPTTWVESPFPMKRELKAEKRIQIGLSTRELNHHSR